MNDTNCEDVKAVLPELVDESGMSLAVRRHLSRCPECTGELEAYRSLRDATSRLALATAAPPPGLMDALVAIPAAQSKIDEVRSHVARHRREYAAGVAVVVGAAGAALWRSRRRGLATA